MSEKEERDIKSITTDEVKAIVEDAIASHKEINNEKMLEALAQIKSEVESIHESVDRKVEKSRANILEIVDGKVKKVEENNLTMISRVMDTINTVNQTVSELSKGISPLTLNVAKLTAQLQSMESAYNQVANRQNDITLQLQGVQNDQRQIRDDVDDNQKNVSRFDTLITAQGQTIGQLNTVIYGNGGNQESVFGILRELQEAGRQRDKILADLVSWQNTVKGWSGRLSKAFEWWPVKVAAAGAATTGGLAAFVELLSNL